jgi:hypothetical protein
VQSNYSSDNDRGRPEFHTNGRNVFIKQEDETSLALKMPDMKSSIP